MSYQKAKVESAIDNKSNEPERRKSRDPLVGTVLDGRFEIEEVLGSGGMSVVYKATQLRVNRHVAIKTIRLQLDSKPIYRERFEREISSLCALSHPHIVTVYDCIIGQDDQPYVVMDYLRGKSLETLIQQDGPLAVERFGRIFVQVCSALDHAHRKGIIHRDIKPGNIVLIDNETDYVKVVDFGLAKIGEDNRKLTQSGELWGSPPYMSPEQCQGKSGDERSDIYSLGAVMFEMLTGHDPFYQAASVFELIQNHVNTPIPSFNEIRPGINVPYKVEQVVRKAMAKEPADRYQSAQELQDAIIDACSGASDRDSGDLVFGAAGGRSKPPSGEVSKESLGPSTVSAAAMFNRALDPFGSEDFSAFAINSNSGGAESLTDHERENSVAAESPSKEPPPAPPPPPPTAASRMRQLEVPSETKPKSNFGMIAAVVVGIAVLIGAAFAVPQVMKGLQPAATVQSSPAHPAGSTQTTSAPSPATNSVAEDNSSKQQSSTTSGAKPSVASQSSSTTAGATRTAPRRAPQATAASVRTPLRKEPKRAAPARAASAPSKGGKKDVWKVLESLGN